MSLFSQHPASAKYALKLTEILLYRERGISRFRRVVKVKMSKKGGVKTRKKPVKMSLFSQHPASAKYALKLTEILLYREGGISRFRWVVNVTMSKKGGVKTRKKPVKMSLFSQHPASAKYALKLTVTVLDGGGGIPRFRWVVNVTMSKKGG